MAAELRRLFGGQQLENGKETSRSKLSRARSGSIVGWDLHVAVRKRLHSLGSVRISIAVVSAIARE